MKKQLLISLAKYGLGIGLFAWVIGSMWAPRDSSPGLAGILQQPLHPLNLLLAGLICLASVLLTYYRWYLLVRAQELPFTLFNALRLGLIGYTLSTFFPGSVGGDIVKAYCIAREQRRRTVAIATVVVDRLVGLWALCWLVALLGGTFWLAGDPALASQQSLQIVLGTTVVLVAVSSVVWYILLLLPERRARRFAVRLNAIPKVGHAAAECWRAVWMYRNQWRTVVVALLLSLVSHCGFVLTFWFSVQVFYDPAQPLQIPSLPAHFLLVPVGMTIQALPLVPGGIGIGEIGFGKLYEMVGQPGVKGVAGSLTQRLIICVIALVGYLVYLRMRAEVAAGAIRESPIGEPLPSERAVEEIPAS